MVLDAPIAQGCKRSMSWSRRRTLSGLSDALAFIRKTLVLLSFSLADTRGAEYIHRIPFVS